MSNDFKLTDTEQEFLELMGIKFENDKFIKIDSKEEFKFDSIYKQRPHSRTDIVYVYPFRCNDTELLFFRKEGKPTMESLVVKYNGEKYIVGEDYTEENYSKRIITFVGRESEYYNIKIHLISKPFISGKYFFETSLLIEDGRYKYPTKKAKFGPEEAIDSDIYSKKYNELINRTLEDSKEAREFFLKVFPFFNSSYMSALEIPIIYSDNFLNSLSDEEDRANNNYDEINNHALRERNERLLDILERRKKLEEYLEKSKKSKI